MIGWFANLTIARKLTVGFGVVLLLMTSALATDIAASTRQTAITERIVHHLFPARVNARDIVTLVRAADDDGYWAQGALIHDPAHSRALFHLYYQELHQIRTVLAAALRLADTPAQRDAIRRFHAFYFGAGPTTAADRALLDEQTHWDVIDGHSGYTIGNEQNFVLARRHQWVAAFYGYTTIPFVPALQDAQRYIDVVQGEIARATAQEAAAARLVLVLSLALGALALALGLGIAILIARAIVRPLAEVQHAAQGVAAAGDILAAGMQALAQGDLTVAAEADLVTPVYRSRDETGRTAEAMRHIIAGLGETISAYEHARGSLRGLIGQISTAAQHVDAGAGRLTHVTEQIGAASDQIARASAEVARGAGEQSRGSAEAVTQMSTLAAAVAQVADGAATQVEAVSQAAQAISDLRAALVQTTENVAAVAGVAEHAAGTARDGGAAVAQTLTSIDAVRAAVAQSAAQVQELDRHSAEIGQIVAAIDDIAAQTNLLALNAAIEAARAGEHGKGFAVVAAEVRKLAERATSETTAITQRISGIQQQVAEVVMAMEAGQSEVGRSTVLGEQAQRALDGILSVVEQTSVQARAIDGAVARMTSSVEAVGGAAERVADVATQTAAATERMQAGAEQVGTVMESIAAVSEQSAAGAEEVSASTEEQSAGVQEMAAGAQELAALAAALHVAAARFTLEPATASDARGAEGADPGSPQPRSERRRGGPAEPHDAPNGVIPRRRSDDWTILRA